jgi:holo-[acyl-carrier protein] synthase
MSFGQLRVGTDIQSIDEVASSIRTFGRRYVERVFTPHEVEASGGLTPDAAPGLAARFAAKESAMKVLRPDDDALPWTSIEIVRAVGGWTELRLHGAALQMAESAGLHGFAVSLSHGAGIATATVVATRTSELDGA